MVNINDIDYKLRDVILILNNKGYTTKFCCEGHWKKDYNSYKGGYILFEDKVFEEIEPPISESHSMMPKGKTPSKMRTNYYYITKNKRTLCWEGSDYKNESYEDKTINHNNFLLDLLIWANNLPNRKDGK